MMKRIGNKFSAEVRAAGLAGLPFSWCQDGTIEFGEGMSREQIAAVNAAYEAHDPDGKDPVQEIERIESSNPITHRAEREETLGIDYILRALREKINALDAEVAVLAGRAAQPLQPIPVSHLLRAVKAVDDLIKAERAKL